MADIINKDSNTIKEVTNFITAYISAERGITSTFPGGKDNLTNAVNKIRQIIIANTSTIPKETYIPTGFLDFGVSDEELKIDFYKGYDYPEAKNKMLNHEIFEPTWRPAAYTIPAVKSYEIPMTFSLQEFTKVSRNASEAANFAMAKSIAFDNAIIHHENALRKNARREFIKLILKIYKHAPAFATNTQYKTTNQNNVQTYGIDLTYLKNQDGTKVGVVYKQIEANDGYQTYEEAEEGGKIRTLSLIKKISKPGSGTTKAKQAETSDNFIKELLKLQSEILNENLDGSCLNGSFIGLRDNVLTKIWLSDVFANLRVNTFAGAYNRSDMMSALIDNPVVLNSFFDKKEIEDDEAGDKLGLKDVYGCLFDFTGPIPLFSVGYDFTAPSNDVGNYTHLVNEVDVQSDIVQMRYVMKPYYKISPNKYCLLIVHVDPE